MSPQESVNVYYDAWRTKQGDFSDVPLAEDLSYEGPIASFDSPEGAAKSVVTSRPGSDHRTALKPARRHERARLLACRA